MDDPAFAETALGPDEPVGPALDDTAPEPGPDAAKTALEPGPPSVSPSPGAAQPGPTPGRRVGLFEIVRELARGGMGVVYVARHPSLERLFALKVMLAGDEAGSHELARFAVEARAAARLRHPNIVGVHDVGEIDGRPYIAMDLIPGESLKRRLEAGVLAPRDAASITARLARAVAYAHTNGVLHRDIKPANVLMQSDTEPVLTDFGLAKVAGQDLTVSGQLLGTPAYMPPEQAQGHRVDGRADVYSIGATLYEMLVGRPPFVGASALKIIADVVAKEPARPRAVRPDLPADLETVVLTCLEKDPERRYATADALADDLERYLRDEPVRARAASALERAWRWCRRNPAPSIAWALTIVVAIMASFAAVLASREAALIQQRTDAEAATQREALARAEAQARAEEEGRKTAAAEARRDEEARERRKAEAIAGDEINERIKEEARAEHELGNRHAAAHRWREAALAFAGACEDGVAQEAPVRRGLLLDAVSRVPPLDVVPRDGRHSSKTGALAWSPAGDLLIIAHDAGLRAWDPVNRREVWAAPGRASIERLAFSPDGGRLLVEGARRLSLRDGRTGAVLAERATPSDRVFVVRWSNDGERLAVGISQAIEVLDGRTLASLATVPDHGDGFNTPLQSLAWTRDGALAFVAYRQRESLKVWRPDATTTLTHVANRDRHEGAHGKVCAVSGDGAYVAAGCRDGIVHVWKVADGSCFAATRERDLANAKDVTWLEFAPAGAFHGVERLATFDEAHKSVSIRLWELRPGYSQGERLQLVRALEQLTDQLEGPPTWSPDGARLACADRDGRIHVWETRTGALETLLQGQSGREGIGHRPLLVWSPDDARLAAVDRESDQVHVWTLTAPSPARRLRADTDRVERVAWTGDGERVASDSGDSTSRMWDASTGAPLGLVRGAHPHGEVFVSPDGARAIALSSYGTLRLLDARTLSELAPLGDAGSVRNVVWSSDGAKVAVLSGEWSPWRARVWDRDGRVVATLETKLPTDRGTITWRPGGVEVAIAFGGRGMLLWTPGESPKIFSAPEKDSIDAFVPAWSKDGARLAGVSTHGRGGALWTADGTRLAEMNAYMETVAWSPDGARVATASGNDGKGVTVWDGGTGAVVWTVTGANARRVTCLSWSADGAFLAGAAEKDGGWIRDGATGGAALVTWKGSASWPQLAWSPSAPRSLLAVTFDDALGEVLVLDPRERREVARVRAHRDMIRGIAWRPTGDVLATAGDDGVVGLWDLGFALSSSTDLVRWLEENRAVR